MHRMIQPQIQISISEERRDYLFSSPSLFYYFRVRGRFAANMVKCEHSIKLCCECMGAHCVCIQTFKIFHNYTN